MTALQLDLSGLDQLEDMPLEILEMIFGMINFVDLPNFLLACKWINVRTHN